MSITAVKENRVWKSAAAAIGLLLAGSFGLVACVADVPDEEADREQALEPWRPDVVLPDTNSAVMLQGFHWESHMMAWWSLLEQQAAAIAADGFDMVWMPPSGGAASDEGYLPHRLYYQHSNYGTQDQLQRAINALHGQGVRTLADIVVNHRVGTGGWANFTDPVWGADSVCRNDEWQGAQGSWDTGDGYSAARDIDHTKPYVQQSLSDWLRWMKTTIGYDGWRYDFVKGFSGQYVSRYNNDTRPYFSVGELWTDFSPNNPDSHRQQLCDWVNSTGGRSAAFDFTTKAILQQALGYGEYWRLKDGQGKPSGMIGWWPAKAVTFLDNHDTGPSTGGQGGQNHWPFPSGAVLQGYAYILTHPGVPCVYWPHVYDWQGLHDPIAQLIRLRKESGITSTSPVEIKVADGQRYAAIIDGKLAMKIGPGDWAPGDGWVVAASGDRWAVWKRQAAPPPPGGTVRTVIYMEKQTSAGEDIFLRGGHDEQLVRSGFFAGMAEPIRYNNTLNTTTASTKNNDPTLDWGSDSALDWTCPVGASAYHTANNLTYQRVGYGIDPENTYGSHYWKFDVNMEGQAGDWFEFKAFMRRGSSVSWEGDIRQAGTPYSTRNHWARKGYITVVSFNGNNASYYPINP